MQNDLKVAIIIIIIMLSVSSLFFPVLYFFLQTLSEVDSPVLHHHPQCVSLISDLADFPNFRSFLSDSSPTAALTSLVKSMLKNLPMNRPFILCGFVGEIDTSIRIHKG